MPKAADVMWLSENVKMLLRKVVKALPAFKAQPAADDQPDDAASFQAAFLAALAELPMVRAGKAAAADLDNIRSHAETCAALVRKRMRDARKRKHSTSHTADAGSAVQPVEQAAAVAAARDSATEPTRTLSDMVRAVRTDWVDTARSVGRRVKHLRRADALLRSVVEDSRGAGCSAAIADGLRQTHLLLQTLFVRFGADLGRTTRSGTTGDAHFPLARGADGEGTDDGGSGSDDDQDEDGDSIARSCEQLTVAVLVTCLEAVMLLQDQAASGTDGGGSGGGAVPIVAEELAALEAQQYRLAGCLLLLRPGSAPAAGLGCVFRFLEVCRTRLPPRQLQRVRIQDLLPPAVALQLSTAPAAAVGVTGDDSADAQAVWCAGVARYVEALLPSSSSSSSSAAAIGATAGVSTAVSAANAATRGTFRLFLQAAARKRASPEALAWVRTNAGGSALFSDSLRQALETAKTDSLFSILVDRAVTSAGEFAAIAQWLTSGTGGGGSGGADSGSGGVAHGGTGSAASGSAGDGSGVLFVVD